MFPARWLAFRDSRLLAVRCDASCARVELDARIQQWEGAGSSRCGTAWIQRVQIELDFPDVDQGIAALPATIWSGTATSDAISEARSAGLSIPTSIEAMTVLELVTASGEILRICGERLRASPSGEARFLEEIPRDMDPERGPAR